MSNTTFRDDFRRSLRPIARLFGAVPVPNLSLPGILGTYLLPEDDADFTTAYKIVPTIQFAIEFYQTVIAGTPLRFYVGRGDARKEIERAPGNIVEVWQNANTEDTGFDLIEQLVGSLETHGKAYLFKDYLGSSTVQQFWMLYPPDVRPVPARVGRGIVEYEVRNGNSIVRVPRQQIVHFKRYDPDFGYNGLSRLSSLRLSYETQRDAARFHREFFRRGGTVAGHYSTEQSLDDDDIERLKKDVEQRYQGPENAWKPVVLPRKLQFVRAGLTFAEMQFVESEKLTTTQVLRLFKIHPILASENVSAGLNSDVASTAMMIALRFGIFPACQRIVATLNERLLASGEFGRDVTCDFDFSKDPVLVEAWLKNAAAWTNATGAPVASRAQARERLELDEEDDPESLRELLVPISLMTESERGEEPAVPPATSPAPPAPSPAEDDGGAPESEGGKSPDRGSPSQARTSRDAIRRRNDRLLKVSERRVRAEALRIFRGQRARIVAAVEAQGEAKTGEPRSVSRVYDLDAILADLDDPNDRKRVKRLIRAIVEDSGAMAIADLALDVAFDMTDREIAQWIEEKGARFVTAINETTRDRLRSAIAEASTDGGTLGEIVSAVDGVFAGRRGNAETIARTETAPAFNFGATEAWKQSGVVGTKVWLTAGDEAVREAHAAAEGQEVPLDADFSVGGESLSFPGDPQGSVGNIANCRCTCAPGTIAGVEEAAPLPKALADRLAGGFAKRNGDGRLLTVEEFLAGR